MQTQSHGDSNRCMTVPVQTGFTHHPPTGERQRYNPMTTIYKFANYTFDAHAGLVFEGRPVHLPPKEKGLLHALLVARGQIVRKEDLMVKVWGTHETSDESISRTVYRLRVAMQAAAGPRWSTRSTTRVFA
jgi:DNA-binding response OmpR family regulator